METEIRRVQDEHALTRASSLICGRRFHSSRYGEATRTCTTAARWWVYTFFRSPRRHSSGCSFINSVLRIFDRNPQTIALLTSFELDGSLRYLRRQFELLDLDRGRVLLTDVFVSTRMSDPRTRILELTQDGMGFPSRLLARDAVFSVRRTKVVVIH